MLPKPQLLIQLGSEFEELQRVPETLWEASY
jgi:hypothetical protein